MDTSKEYNLAVETCRQVFTKKTIDYGTAWRILRPLSVTDQIYIKAQRIRTLEENETNVIDDNIFDEFIGIVNYGIIGIIQMTEYEVNPINLPIKEANDRYDEIIEFAKDLMYLKNTDYGEAWRSMRISSFTDLILMKLFRTKQIEDNNGKTLISEGIEANYYDMINYAIFALIRLQENNEKRNQLQKPQIKQYTWKNKIKIRKNGLSN